MANIFLDANDSFTQSSTNTNDAIFGRAGGSETVILQGNPTGTTLDGNVEVVQIASAAADTTLQVNATTGRLELVSGGTVFASFSGGLNQAVNMQFTDGNVTLTQTGANDFTVATPGSTTGAVTINTTTSQTGSAVTLGAETSTANATPVVAGQTFVLDATNTSVVGSAGDDTFDGSLANSLEGRSIIDIGGTDTLNATLTAPLTNATSVIGVENVNLDWDAFATAVVDLANVSGATVTGTSDKVGFLGSFTANNAGDNTIVAGSGMTGTLTVDGATLSTVNAGQATAVDVTAEGTATAADILVLNAGVNTTSVTVTDFDQATVNAGTASTITVTDDNAGADDGNTLQLTVGADATVTNDVDDLTIVAGTTGLTITVSEVDASLTFAGEAATLNVAASSDLDAKIVNNTSSGVLTLTIDDHDGAADLDQVAAATISVAAASAGGALTIASGTTVVAETDLASAYGLTVAGAGTSDTATLRLNDDQTKVITLTDIETTTIIANATVDASAVDLTITDVVAGTNRVVLTGSNDVTVTEITAGSVDASGLTNDLIITQDATAADLSISGGTKENTVVFTGTTHDSSYTGQDGDDTVTFVTTTGSATAILGGGTNSVVANALTTGDLVVVSGIGADTVSATALTTGEVNLQLSDGDNSITLDGTFNSVTVTVVTGSGSDTVTIDNATVAGDTLNLNFGGGTTDTLVISEDITAGTQTISGLERIDVGGDSATAIVNGNLLNGQSYELRSDGTNTGGVFTTTLLAEMDAAGTLDLSNLVLNNTVTDGIGGITLTASTGTDVIIATTGNDDITSSGGNDTITGGTGLDVITLDAGTEVVVLANDDGVDLGVIADVGGDADELEDTDTITAEVETITTFTSGTDKLDLDGTFTFLVDIVGLTGEQSAGDLGLTDGQAGFINGDYAAGVFTVAAAGADLMFAYDADATVGTSDIETLVLVGVTAMAIGDLI